LSHYFFTCCTYIVNSSYKKYAIRAAKELLYPYEIVKKIRQAKNESEISHIMSNARKSNAVKELNKGKDEGKDEEQDG
jgi:hypothetical protein